MKPQRVVELVLDSDVKRLTGKGTCVRDGAWSAFVASKEAIDLACGRIEKPRYVTYYGNVRIQHESGNRLGGIIIDIGWMLPLVSIGNTRDVTVIDKRHKPRRAAKKIVECVVHRRSTNQITIIGIIQYTRVANPSSCTIKTGVLSMRCPESMRTHDSDRLLGIKAKRLVKVHK